LDLPATLGIKPGQGIFLFRKLLRLGYPSEIGTTGS